MSQQNKRASTSAPADPLAKRKRGRPRKDENPVQKETSQSPQPLLSYDLRSNHLAEFDQSDGIIGDDMVGQAVTGVIEGCFDAGYFLSVRLANKDTLLRGVVFQPGKFTPITPANDVASHVKMYKRKEFPLPILNSPGQVNDTSPLDDSGFLLVGRTAKKNSKNDSLGGKDMPQVVSESGIGNQSNPQNSVCPFPLSNKYSFSASPFPLATQSSSAAVPLTSTSFAASLGGKTFPQQDSDSGLQQYFPLPNSGNKPFPLASKCASVTLPPTDSLSKNISDVPQKNTESFKSSLGNQPIPQFQIGTPFSLPNQTSTNVGKNVPEQNLELGFENLTSEASTLVERPKVDVEGTKDEIIEIASEPSGEGKSINEVPQVQNQDVDSAHGSSDLAHDELKSGNIALDLTLVGANTSSLPFEKVLSPENDITPRVMQSGLAENSGKDEFGQNRKPVTGAADKDDGVSQSAPEEEKQAKIVQETTISDCEMNNTGGSFQFLPQTNHPLTFMQESSVSAEPEVADGGKTNFPGKDQIPSL